jgi:hypothetical protein
MILSNKVGPSGLIMCTHWRIRNKVAKYTLYQILILSPKNAPIHDLIQYK